MDITSFRTIKNI